MPVTEVRTLFEPVALGPLRLRNRLVMAPMGTCLDNGGHITDEAIAYYVRRARGGVGTITVEGCLVSQETVGPEPKISGPEYLPGLKKLVAALKSYDVTVGVQLMHPGRQVVAGPAVAPSPVPLNSHAPVPHELSAAEIAVIVDDYARAADLALEAGFEFVEVHGAHGYLPSTFLSPLDNQRRDDYGGSPANRARFSLEVARAIVATGAPLVWRINGEDAVPGGFTLDECVQVSHWLQEAGAIAISVSAGTWHTLHVTLAPMFVPRGHMRHYAAAVKAAVDVPVIAVGRLDDPDLAADVIASGDADLILLGRTLIAEPDWPRKVEAARLNELRPCIACNACVDLVGRGEIARCAVNPEAGRELTWAVPPAETPRRVMVVGSGPAGMEAARIARLRGHAVSIWERDDRLGGKLQVAGLAPSKREVLRFRDFQARRLAEVGVEIHLNADVTADVVATERPDAVLVATGAEPLIPPIPGIGSALVDDAQRFLRDELRPAEGERVVVVGGSATGCETAEHLAALGVPVTILEMRKGVGFGIEAITRRHLIRALKKQGVEIVTGAKVVMIEHDHVLYEDPDGVQHAVGADHVALAIGWRPVGNQLADELHDVEVVVLGDASRPSDFVSAINAGADAGLAL
ncbi:NAD(P)/FAD-dependent oxidoreductase [Solirubrobacter soli]|uniref:NAD(P)/FAD-dependent oxidoreductase n=1 Tax=Solirubrobacter soli TaxID=363832 RepID=UPI00040F1A26|nr:NAD(P)/FAD-dependent oxidoreductase [Solirubrobacter soli]